MNQTWANGKKPNFGPDFGLFWLKFGRRLSKEKMRIENDL